MAYFPELDKIFQKFLWAQRRPHVATAILRKKNKCGGILPPDNKPYYKVIVIKTAWYCIKTNTEISGTEYLQSPEINSHLYGQVIYGKGGKNIQWVKESLFRQIHAKN